jgi:hypothetical protein
VNCDGVVNSVDAALVLQFVARLTALRCPEQGLVNSDHIVNAVDAALILQYDARLVETLPPPARIAGWTQRGW